MYEVVIVDDCGYETMQEFKTLEAAEQRYVEARRDSAHTYLYAPTPGGCMAAWHKDDVHFRREWRR